MIDFKLTENGDIDIAEAYQYPYFIIQYNISARDKRNQNNIKMRARRYNSFRIDFDTDIKQYQFADTGFQIQFSTEKRIMPYRPIGIRIVQDKAELAQEVAIRLKTEKGEFSFNPDFGSELVTLRHQDIKSETILNKAQQFAEEAIADTNLPEDYTVTAAWKEEQSRYKHERLKITVDTDQETIYEAAI